MKTRPPHLGPRPPLLRGLWLASLFLPVLTACTTTGDPREGGLFGWSETKAIARQNMLREQYEVSASTEQTLRRQQANLQTQRTRLQRDVTARDQQLQALQRDLAALRSALQSGDLTPEAAATRANVLRGPVADATGPGSDALRADFATIDEQINLLTQ